MEHWVKVCKKTGHCEFLVMNEGVHPTQAGYNSCEKTHKFTRLEREPGELDVFDRKTGKLTACKVTKEKLERRAKLNNMSREELVDFIEEMIDARLRHHNLI